MPGVAAAPPAAEAGGGARPAAPAGVGRSPPRAPLLRGGRQGGARPPWRPLQVAVAAGLLHGSQLLGSVWEVERPQHDLVLLQGCPNQAAGTAAAGRAEVGMQPSWLAALAVCLMSMSAPCLCGTLRQGRRAVLFASRGVAQGQTGCSASLTVPPNAPPLIRTGPSMYCAIADAELGPRRRPVRELRPRCHSAE